MSGLLIGFLEFFQVSAQIILKVDARTMILDLDHGILLEVLVENN